MRKRDGKPASKTITYMTWNGMKARCLNKKDKTYHRYGGRGITVCERWMKFKNFFADMGEKPVGLTLERINNNGNYEPGNCRWATAFDQNRNQRRTVNITFDGKTMCQTDWADHLGMGHRGLAWRLKHWPLEKALTSPHMRQFMRTNP